MGCAQSFPARRSSSQHDAVLDEPIATSASASLHPRETRILQSDVVDTCVSACHTPPERDASNDADADAEARGQWEALVGDGDGADDSVATPCLFEDADFDADAASLGFSASHLDALTDVQWRRPCELCATPLLFVDGVSGGDVRQGLLGDCWFLSACAAIARHASLIEKVVSPAQALCGAEYRGELRVHFCRFGRWTGVRIDDRLPVLRGRLAFASCADPAEFWVALVEKAYAKLHGSYEAIAGGHALDAFVDLTGGLAEKLHAQSLAFRQLRTAFDHGAFVTCARKGEDEVLERNGLVRGHAYTVTDLRRVQLRSINGNEDDDSGAVELVRVRNPWADANEWTGAWRDGDALWDDVDLASRQRLGVAARADGEFWMAFADFRTEFDEVTVATLGPDFDCDGLADEPRQVLVAWGSWQEGINAGGSRNDIESFARNPQYLLTVTDPDCTESVDSASDEDALAKCSLLIGLMQEHRRSQRNRERRMLPIAFFVYKSEEASPDGRLSPEYLLCVPEVGTSGPFTDSREVLCRLALPPGAYVLVPATFSADVASAFLLRVFALRPATLLALPEAEGAPLTPC